MINQYIFATLIDKLLLLVSSIGNVRLTTDGGIMLYIDNNDKINFIIQIGGEITTHIEDAYRISIKSQIYIHEPWNNCQNIIILFKNSIFKDIITINLLGKIDFIYQIDVVVDVNIYFNNSDTFDFSIIEYIILDILSISESIWNNIYEY